MAKFSNYCSETGCFFHFKCKKDICTFEIETMVNFYVIFTENVLACTEDIWFLF